MKDVDSLRWLSLCRHHVRGAGASYLLIFQHHVVSGSTRIVAPVVPIKGNNETLLAPHLLVGSAVYRAILLDMTSVSIKLIGERTEPARIDEDAVTAGLDAIFRGYPVGLPIT